MIRDPWHSRTEIKTFVNKTLVETKKSSKISQRACVIPKATVPTEELWFFAEGHANNVMTPCHVAISLPLCLFL